jgi:hypothetical protein
VTFTELRQFRMLIIICEPKEHFRMGENRGRQTVVMGVLRAIGRNTC